MEPIDYQNRNKEMFKLKETGWTMNEIGKLYGITRERVRQITLKMEKGWYKWQR